MSLKARAKKKVATFEERFGNAANVFTVVPAMTNALPGLMSDDPFKITESVLTLAGSIAFVIPPPFGTAASAILSLSGMLVGLGAAKGPSMQEMLNQAVTEVTQALASTEMRALAGEFSIAIQNIKRYEDEYQVHQSILAEFATDLKSKDCASVAQFNRYHDQLSAMITDDIYMARITPYMIDFLTKKDRKADVVTLLFGYCHLTSTRKIGLLTAMGVVYEQYEDCGKVDTVKGLYGILVKAYERLDDNIRNMMKLFERTDDTKQLWLMKYYKALPATDKKKKTIEIWRNFAFTLTDGSTRKYNNMPLIMPNGPEGSSFTQWYMCPKHRWVRKFSQWIEDETIDPTGLSELEIKCGTASADTSTIKFGMGKGWGIRYERSCAGRGFLWALNTCVGSASYGVISLAGRCGDWSLSEIQSFSMCKWNWSKEAKCPYKYAVCGFSLRMESYVGAFSDDSAINEVVGRCCSLADWNRQVVIRIPNFAPQVPKSVWQLPLWWQNTGGVAILFLGVLVVCLLVALGCNLCSMRAAAKKSVYGALESVSFTESENE